MHTQYYRHHYYYACVCVWRVICISRSALMALRKKKYQSTLLGKAEQQMLNLEEMVLLFLFDFFIYVYT